MRGISFYPASRFEDGRKSSRVNQKRRHQRRGERGLALPVHGENSRRRPGAGGPAEDRPGQDACPLMQVYALFQGTDPPADAPVNTLTADKSEPIQLNRRSVPRPPASG